MSIFGRKDKTRNMSCNFAYVAGIESLTPNIAVTVTQNDEERCIEVAMRMSKQPPLRLPYQQIVAVDCLTEKDIVEKSKNVLGRAAVGGLLLGPLGAMVGGISGVGVKKSTDTTHYFVVNYRPSTAPQDIEAISFKVVGASLSWSNFLISLRKKTAQPIPQQL